MEFEGNVVTMWLDIKEIIDPLDPLEFDVVKNAKGNVAAGARVRKRLRVLKTRSAKLVKLTIQLDKARRKLRAQNRTHKRV